MSLSHRHGMDSVLDIILFLKSSVKHRLWNYTAELETKRILWE